MPRGQKTVWIERLSEITANTTVGQRGPDGVIRELTIGAKLELEAAEREEISASEFEGIVVGILRAAGAWARDHGLKTSADFRRALSSSATDRPKCRPTSHEPRPMALAGTT